MIYRNGVTLLRNRAFWLHSAPGTPGQQLGHIGQGSTPVTQGLELNPCLSGLELNPCHKGLELHSGHTEAEVALLSHRAHYTTF